MYVNYCILLDHLSTMRNTHDISYGSILKAKQQHAGVSQDLTGRHETPGLMMRILGPVTTFVNQPWKVTLSYSTLYLGLF